MSTARRVSTKPKTKRSNTLRWVGTVLALWFINIGAIATGGTAQRESTEQPTATDEPWVELKKGLKIRDLVVGTGAEAKRGKRASVRYAGWLEDGTVFDTNRSRALWIFEVGGGQAIKGWDLGVVGMKTGGTRQLLIPAKLAYGKRGIPGRIPRDATLLFEIDLRGAF